MNPACQDCIHRKISQAVEVWAELGDPADRQAAWGRLSELLNLKIAEPEISTTTPDRNPTRPITPS